MQTVVLYKGINSVLVRGEARARLDEEKDKQVTDYSNADVPRHGLFCVDFETAHARKGTR